MIAVSPRWFVLLVLPLLFVPVFAAEPDDQEIARLIKQLGDDDFDKREAANKRLLEIGEPALDALQKAKLSGDAEVRRRAEEVIPAIENKLVGEQRRLIGHTLWVSSISVSADGKRLLTGSFDKTLRLWDVDSGKCLRVFEGHTERIIGAALSPDGKRLLSGSTDGTVRLWDADSGKEVLKMTAHTEAVLSVAFGPEGQALSGSCDRTMRLWDLKTGKNSIVFTGHSNYVRTVAYSDKAKLAATFSYDRSIRLWNLESGKELRVLLPSRGPRIDPEDMISQPMSLCFSPDGKRLLSAGGDNTIRLWDVETGKERERIIDAHPWSAAFSPDGKRIVGGVDTIVFVWDAETGKELCKYQGHNSKVTAVTFFPDGKRIASASSDHTARIWYVPR